MKKRRLTFRCPHCSHSFIRTVGSLDGKTRCPKCSQQFQRVEGNQVGDFGTAARKEVHERKVARNEMLFARKGITLAEGEVSYDHIIRGTQVPNVSAEAVFKSNCLSRGWLPHRPSWPDYLVETPKGVSVSRSRARTISSRENSV